MAKSTRTSEHLRVALVGSETLLGKEVEEMIKSRTEARVSSFSATGEGNFGGSEGEAVYVEPLDAGTIAKARAVVIAGGPGGAEKAYQLAHAAGGAPIVIDCTGFLENKPEARITAPLVTQREFPKGWLWEVAHPAASALMLVLERLAHYQDLRRVIVHIFEPASEQGRRGVAELHQQTTSLLSFKQLDKQVFDTQLSFNLLAQYGEEGIAKLAAAEQRIERHLATLIGSAGKNKKVPLPSLRVIAAPVFHGYSFSIWAEFEADINAESLGEALACAQIEVRGANEEAPSGVSIAGLSGLSAGDIRIDHNNPRAAWLWIVGDNLRLTADAVAEIVNHLQAHNAE